MQARTSHQPRWRRTRALAALIAIALAGCGGGGSAPDAAPTASPRTAPVSTAPPVAGAGAGTLRLVAIGDSIPYNSPDDCPGCTSFVDRYARALEEATGRPVEAENLSQHNSLTLPMLMDELDRFEAPLAAADAIIVGVAHNSILLNADAACGTTWDPAANTFVDWSVIDADCSEVSAAEYGPMYDELFATVAGWRAGRPTILLALDKYNDWIGWADGHLTPELERTTTMVHDDWNAMLCAAAQEHGFACVQVNEAFNGPGGDLDAGELLAADHTHPSDRGNEVIAALLAAEGFAPLA